ncbi:MAG: DUF3850 domain-containing protein [Minisyncoccota bacterium]
MSQEHKLKTLARYYEAVERGEKTFEVRRNDRAFQTGDILILEKMDNEGRYYETIPGHNFNAKSLRKRITYLLQGGQFGIEPGFCVLGLGEPTP